MIKDVQDALFWWLEEFPVSEMVSEDSQKIVTQYRKGNTDVTQAMKSLTHFCGKEIEEWIQQNKTLSTL
jgi:uncharacterized protein YbgA (DUF1722 family)